MAYACRYGNIGLMEAGSISMEHLGGFLNALSEIVEEENSKNST